MADNFRFDMAGARLEDALVIAFSGRPNGTAKGWEVQEREDKPPRLILYWADSKRAQMFPTPLTREEVAGIIRSWLAATTWDPPTIWHDATTGQGSRVYNEDWGHIDRQWEAFAAVEPYQLLYGK